MKDTSELLVQSVTLLRRQWLLTERVIVSGALTLRRFEKSVIDQKANVEDVLDVLNYAFSLIDNLVKFQKVAGSIPQ